MACVNRTIILWTYSRRIAGSCPARAAIRAVTVTTAMMKLYGTVWNTRQVLGKNTFNARITASIRIFSTTACPSNNPRPLKVGGGN